MSLPFILKPQRVLVVVPSIALRKQTTGHFKVLSTVRKINVLDSEIPNPSVLSQEERPTSTEDWNLLKEYDVVISTPSSMSPSLAPNPPIDLFDLIIIDEAHHVPAETWLSFIKYFKDSRFVFLTATPYRRDRKPIPGRIAYWYPVLKASKENAFGKVKYVPAIVEDSEDNEKVDLAIVKSAITQLKIDQEAGFDHRIFARASSIVAARKLVKIYENEGCKIAAIASHISKRHQDKIEKQLIDGDIVGVVCVDMFGEGYDFPKLKIAALHAPHKSLVPTVQFIGRFARTNDSSTGDATLIAPPNRIRFAISSLFQEGVDVSELIDDLSQAEIENAEADREILEILKLRKLVDSDYEAVSPLLLKLYAHAMIFECNKKPDFSLIEDTIGRNLLLAKQWLSDDGLITLLLTVDNSPPNWAISDVLVNIRHDIFLLAFNEATGLAYIGSTRRTERLYLDLMQSVCKDQHRHISYEVTRRAIAGLSNLRFYNVGLKNTAINTQSESYRVLTGPRAERSVTDGDARSFVQGHFFGSGSIDNERETIGASSSSRIWSNKRLTVTEYLEWISLLNSRLNGDEEVAPSQLDIVQHAKVLNRIPGLVISGGWNKVAYRNSPQIRCRRKGDEKWQYNQVTDSELYDFSVSDDQLELNFNIGTDSFSVPFVFSIKGGALVKQVSEDWEFDVLSGVDDWIDIGAWLSMNPPVFHAADKSSFQGVNLMQPPATTISSLSNENVITLDWDPCEIESEFDEEKTNGKMTVHEFLENHILQSDGLEALVYDHRSGEAADYISLTRDNDDFVFSLYHCKAAGGDPSGGRVNDVYDVAGQLLKSIAYCDWPVLESHIAHRINEKRHKHPSVFIKGTIDHLQKVLIDVPANKLFFEIYAVQPGISAKLLNEHLADLMAFGLEYVHRGGAAKAAWIVNE